MVAKMHIHLVFRMKIFFVISLCLLTSNAATLDVESIIGGSHAVEKQFPYQVSILVDESTSICGGCLIAPNLVLTAAHCVIYDDTIAKLPYAVVAGVTDIDIGEGHVIKVAKIYAHKKYRKLSDSSVINDIAILRLASEFNVRDISTISTIDVPKDNDESYADKTGIVSGFGWDQISIKINYVTNTIERYGDSDRKLKFAPVKIMSNKKCKTKIETQICGRIVNDAARRGVCSGDSGGPLVCENKVIGIVSYGIASCNEAELHTVYTRVSSYVDFIEGAMKDQPTSDTQVLTIRFNSNDGDLKSKIAAITAKVKAMLKKWFSR